MSIWLKFANWRCLKCEWDWKYYEKLILTKVKNVLNCRWNLSGSGISGRVLCQFRYFGGLESYYATQIATMPTIAETLTCWCLMSRLLRSLCLRVSYLRSERFSAQIAAMITLTNGDWLVRSWSSRSFSSTIVLVLVCHFDLCEYNFVVKNFQNVGWWSSWTKLTNKMVCWIVLKTKVHVWALIKTKIFW